MEAEAVVSTDNTEVIADSGLPSDVDARQAEAAKKNELPDGWNSVEEMAAYIKEMKDKYANLNRDISNEKKAQEADIESTKAEVEKELAQKQAIDELVPMYINNGMSLTDDMIKKAEEAGISREQLELGAYKFKDARQRNASYVGGEENFVKIMEYTSQTFSEDEHKSLQAVVNELTTKGLSTKPLMLGLQTMYEQAIGADTQGGDRIRGNTKQTSLGGYETKAELFRDKAYVDSPAGKNDKGAIARYRQRLANTPDSIWR